MIEQEFEISWLSLHPMEREQARDYMYESRIMSIDPELPFVLFERLAREFAWEKIHSGCWGVALNLKRGPEEVDDKEIVESFDVYDLFGINQELQELKYELESLEEKQSMVDQGWFTNCDFKDEIEKVSKRIKRIQ